MSGKMHIDQICVYYLTLLFQEGKDGIYANLHRLEHHIGVPVDRYVLSEAVCVAVCAIKAVLPELKTWAPSIFQYCDGSLMHLTDVVSK